MTTIERARRFFKRIHYWAGEPSPAPKSWQALDEWDYLMGQCQAGVARALIRQELEEELRAQPSIYKDGLTYGLARAIRILDAVYGREK